MAGHGAEEGGVADDCDALGLVPSEPIFEMFDALLEGLDGLDREGAAGGGIMVPPGIVEMVEIEMGEFFRENGRRAANIGG